MIEPLFPMKQNWHKHPQPLRNPTNTENQVAHLKNAGLNIGLMYGQSGAGGMGASGGAHQTSPEQPQGNPVAMALQTQQIEQQRRMNDAQIALSEY